MVCADRCRAETSPVCSLALCASFRKKIRPGPVPRGVRTRGQKVVSQAIFLKCRHSTHHSTPNYALNSLASILAPSGAVLVVQLVFFVGNETNPQTGTPFDAKSCPDFIETTLITVWCCFGGAFGAFRRKIAKTRTMTHHSMRNCALISLKLSSAPFGSVLVVHLVLLAGSHQKQKFNTPFDAKSCSDYNKHLQSAIGCYFRCAFGAFSR